jgi:hypothetical protein
MHEVASVPLIPKFAWDVPRVFANFGIGTLAFAAARHDDFMNELNDIVAGQSCYGKACGGRNSRN